MPTNTNTTAHFDSDDEAYEGEMAEIQQRGRDAQAHVENEH